MFEYKTKFIIFLKSKSKGYVTIKDSNFFDKFEKEIRKNNENFKIELLVKEGQFIKQYDEIIKIHSNYNLSTAILEELVQYIFTK